MCRRFDARNDIRAASASERHRVNRSVALAALICAIPTCARAADLDLTRATIVAPPGLAGPERQAVRMLAEEVARRSWVEWPTAGTLPANPPAIVVGPTNAVRRLVPSVPAGAIGREGYRIGVAGSTVYVASDDPRGTLFGVGRLLRELRIDREKVTLPADFAEASAPKTPLRGHQIGYRPKTNSYDGWTVAMWEQYIRDLVVFGCNAIELIPPRSDDDDDSPLFPQPPLRMMAAVSRIADLYGLDVWVWYPAMDRDYADAKTVAAALKEWGDVFRVLPRLDAVFVPGGDPGHTPPKVLFPFLQKQTANLKAVHPKAQMWMSPQSFTGPWMEDFFALMKQQPAWLSGLVHGPQVRVSLPELRAKTPARYPIRDYPDITHSYRCQYPVPDWDAAFALTLGREGVNPRPTQMAHIYKYARPHTFGFITYSEGCHDDVNKMLWSALGWDDAADTRTVLRQYGRYFIGPKLGDRFADGLFALEQNWTGPAIDNAGIDETLAKFRAMERDAGPREKLNWRFQQTLYRAYYDGFVRARLRHEVGATDAARAKLREAKQIGSMRAMADAEATLDRAAKEVPALELRGRTGELAEALFQSIRAQLSVPKYHAIAVGRGANFDSIDAPLSDAMWLRSEIAAARKLADEPARLARLATTLDREDPGPGGFYDNLGDPKRQPHLVPGSGWAKDPAYFTSSQTAFARGNAPTNAPRAWWTFAEVHYDTPLQLRYSGLDKTAKYRVRVVYAQAEGRKVRLVAGDNHEVHGFLQKQLEPLEFAIPVAATGGGELTLTWTQEPGAGGAGRGCQVAEVWLLKTGS
ncbi:MAG: hypothetical protein U0746_05045 [Gemmataceae bacterium]